MDVINQIFSYFLETDKTLVFTSETICRNYLFSFVKRHPNKAIFKDRSLSWDNFLLSLLDTKDKRQIKKTERRMFVYSFLSKGGIDRLKYFSSPKYRESIMSYSKSISSFLPFFPSPSDKKREIIPQSMLSDIDILRAEYEKYLEENKLYEKNYLKPELDKIERDRFIFVFPETFTSPIAEEIVKKNLVDIIELKEEERSPFIEYENSLIEIKETLKEIEKAREKYPDSEIAITSPSLTSYKPYLIREAQKRDIPLVFTSSEKLSTYPEGKLIRDIYSTITSNWDIERIKRLLLNPNYPFKDRDLCIKIIRKCVEKKVSNGGREEYLEILSNEEREYFLSLSRSLLSIVDSSNSDNTVRLLREFRDKFFIEGEWDEENNLVFGSVLDILKEMKVEKTDNIISLLIELLDETDYVERTEKEEGIRVYNYPSSCGLLTPVHFIIGLDDKEVEKKVENYPFLINEEERETLNLTQSFLNIYSSPIFSKVTVLSGTTLGFDGARLLPSLFIDRAQKNESSEGDEYNEEREMWLRGSKPHLEATNYQRRSYLRAKTASLKGRNSSVILPSIREKEKSFSVSAIKDFDLCHYRGYTSSILKVRKKEFSPKYYDNIEIGIALHNSVERALKESKKIANIEGDRLEEIFLEELERSKKKRAITTNYEYYNILNKYLEKIDSVLFSKKAPIYSSYSLLGNEIELSKYPLEGKLTISGRADTLLKDDSGNIYILDWKKSGKNDYNSSDITLISLQVILYAILIEYDEDYSPSGGGFYSFDDEEYKIVWPEEKYQTNNGKEGHQGFPTTLIKENALERLEKIKKILRDGNYSPLYSLRGCSMCDYYGLCREKFIAKLGERNE